MGDKIAPPEDSRSRHDRAVQIQILRGLTPEQRIHQAFKLTERTRLLMKQGFRNRHPGLTEGEVHELYLQRLARCHNRNW